MMNSKYIRYLGRHIVTAASAFMPLLATAGIVTGTVKDDVGNAVGDAVIMAVALPDSILVDSSITDPEGMFSLSYDSIAPNLIIASRTGFEKLEFPVADLDASANLVMTPAGDYLEEVTVRSKPRMAKAEGGTFSFSPAFLQKDYPNGAMVLRTLPLIEETGGLIQMLSRAGKPKIWINGRDPMMPATALMDMLQATPTKNIKKVEIITNPTLEQGNFEAGIINFIIEKPELPVVGSISASLDDTHDHFSPTVNAYANFSKNGYALAAYAGYSYFNWYEPSTTRYDYLTLKRTVENRTARRTHQNGISGGLNFQKDIRWNQAIGLNFDINTISVTMRYSTHATTIEPDGSVSRSEALSRMHIPWTDPIVSGRIWYFANFPGIMAIDASIYGWRNGYDQGETLSENPGDAGITGFELISSEDKQSRRKGAGGKVAMSSRFSDKYSVNLSYYGDYSDISERLADTYNADARFGYREFINGVSLSGQTRFGELCTLYAGVKGEFTHTSTDNNEMARAISDSYFDLVPNASLSFSVPPGSQQIQLTYSRKIYRPGFKDLNPFRYWTSATTYEVGNPDEKSYAVERISYYHSFLSNYSAYVKFSHGRNISISYTIDDGQGNSMTSTGNAVREEDLEFGANYSKSFFGGIWRMNAGAWGNYTRNKGGIMDKVINHRGIYWGIDFSSNVIFSRRHMFMGSLSYSYVSRIPWAWVTIKPYHNLFLTVEKNFPWGARIALSSHNLLGFGKKERHTGTDYSYLITKPYYGDGFRLEFSYTFGNQRLYNARRGEKSDSESRAGR